MGWLSKFNYSWQLKGMVLHYLHGLLIPDLLNNGFAAYLTPQ